MPKQIVGSVYWIENNRQTSRVVDVSEAFGDPAQAVAQIQYAESSGDKKQLILARLAFTQFLGKGYRGESESTPRRVTGEVDQERTSKPSREKPSTAKSSTEPVARKVAKKAPKVASKSPGSEPSKAKSSKKSVRRSVARRAPKVASKSLKGEPSREKPSKKAVETKVGRKAPKDASQPSSKRPSRAKSSDKSAGRKAARKVSARKATKRKASTK